ncbi:MAG: hypothetical protein JHC61_04135 [Burkholderiaceae bacterium]|nr:hypothetical protein [Burkholderiaceae bacterium]
MANPLALALLLFFSALVPTVAQAQSAPNTGVLYRMDTRPPEVIFRTGFSSWGTNDNLAEHASGESCSRSAGQLGARSSAFVATTSNPEFARRLARVAVTLTPTGRTYIYTIRSNDNMYNLAESLRAYVPQQRTLAAIAAHQSEWSAYRQIRGEDIVSVTIYRRGYPADYRSNPNYQQQRPHINRGVFMPGVRPQDSPPQIAFHRFNALMVTLCMTAFGCARN